PSACASSRARSSVAIAPCLCGVATNLGDRAGQVGLDPTQRVGRPALDLADAVQFPSALDGEASFGLTGPQQTGRLAVRSDRPALLDPLFLGLGDAQSDLTVDPVTLTGGVGPSLRLVEAELTEVGHRHRLVVGSCH